MRIVFFDTNYFIAFFNARDGLHIAAVRLSNELGRDSTVRCITLLANLTEFLAYFREGSEAVRSEAALFVDRVLSSREIEVLDGDRALFDAGLQLYRDRLDKTYSHVDCMAMIVCRRMSITEILTGDRDFAREGFTILL